MRRKEREITDLAEIEAIIDKSQVCRLGLIDGDTPYVVPLSFGYKDRTVFFHTALKGHKLELIHKNSRVCVEFDLVKELVKSYKICKWGFKYASVIGFGQAEILTDFKTQKTALDLIVKHYGATDYVFDQVVLTKTAVIKVTIDQMTGKAS